MKIFNFLQAKDETGLDIEGPINTAVSIDSPTTEYELTGLKADTHYVIIIKLYNEVGVAEQKFRIKTNQESDGKTKQKYTLVINDIILFRISYNTKKFVND